MEKDKYDLKQFLKGLGVLLFYFISNMCTYLFLDLFGIDYNNLSNLTKQIYFIFYDSLTTLLIIYIFRKDVIPNILEYFKNFKTYFSDYTKYWVIMLILMFISNSIITNYTTTSTSVNQQSIIDILGVMHIYTIYSVMIIAPILEELVFRLAFRKMFLKTNILYIIFSGFMFGFMHVITTLTNFNDLLFIIPYSIPGFIFAYIYTKSDNIMVPIGIHFLHDTVMLGLQILIILI